jgi:hypothetical protein
VSAKKIMSFTNKPVFDTVALFKPTEVYDIEMTKGDKYWEWTKVTKSTAGATQGNSTSVARTASTTNTGGNARGFETPEERAARQVYIVRQSTLERAVEILSVGAKTAPQTADILKLAKELERYVFESTDAQAVANKDVGTIETIDEDVPF